MDIQNRILGECADLLPNDEISVDISEFVNRILLFDTYIFETIKLKEFQRLIDIFGVGELLMLLKSGVIKIVCSVVVMGQVNRGKRLRRDEKKNILPFGSYSFNILRSQQDYLGLLFRDHIDTLRGCSLKEKIKIKNAIIDSRLEPPKDAGEYAYEKFKSDITKDNLSVHAAVSMKLKNKYNIEPPEDLQIDVKEIDDEIFKCESNLPFKLKMDKKVEHDCINNALLAIGNRNLKLENMKNYNALTGFKENELHFFSDSLNFLGDSIDPLLKTKQMARVVTLKFPGRDSNLENKKISAEKLLKLRESRELIEFKDWLRSTSQKSDEDIKHYLNSFKNKASALFSSTPGKVIRFLLSLGIGGYSPEIGTAYGVLDTFILEKLLPKAGPLAFINNSYRSLFENLEKS